VWLSAGPGCGAGGASRRSGPGPLRRWQAPLQVSSPVAAQHIPTPFAGLYAVFEASAASKRRPEQCRGGPSSLTGREAGWKIPQPRRRARTWRFNGGQGRSHRAPATPPPLAAPAGRPWVSVRSGPTEPRCWLGAAEENEVDHRRCRTITCRRGMHGQLCCCCSLSALAASTASPPPLDRSVPRAVCRAQEPRHPRRSPHPRRRQKAALRAVGVGRGGAAIYLIRIHSCSDWCRRNWLLSELTAIVTQDHRCPHWHSIYPD
jgi:hypothetical protein